MSYRDDPGGRTGAASRPIAVSVERGAISLTPRLRISNNQPESRDPYAYRKGQ